MRVQVRPELLRWARERAGLSLDALARRMPHLEAWEQGQEQPTLKQLEKFARATYAPVGYLFLPAPPREEVPIPDFRTLGNARINRPSPDLLEIIYICQQRQEWYRDFARSEGETGLAFVGSATLASDVAATATAMRSALGFSVAERRAASTWTEALRRFIEQADELGVLVMVSGVVGNNTRRKLDPAEFINGADTKAAQMFTLAHELAHLWLGQSALSDLSPVAAASNDVERWCNLVAAELLVPAGLLTGEFRATATIQAETDRLARVFKVSTLVVLRRLHDVGALGREAMWRAYEAELERLLAIEREPGGNFYLTQAARVSKRFARALVVSTLEGQTLHRDAFRLLGFSKLETFRELGQRLGVA
jgi:Zn-dependent peptidase ImmA (M78 family)/transcriptional regulator with XRE-family HTH domain